MEIWNPASYEWDIGPVLTRIDPIMDIGYAVTYTNGPSHSWPQGDLIAQFVQSTLLGSSRGVLMFTGLHGHDHPVGTLVAVYATIPGQPGQDEANRNADLIAMNAFLLKW
jgi:hypothetical protein